MTHINRHEVYAGSMIEDDIRQEATRLGRALVWECVDGALATSVAVIFFLAYRHPIVSWIDVLGRMTLGLQRISLLLPLLCALLAAMAISRLLVALRCWRERRTLLS